MEYFIVGIVSLIGAVLTLFSGFGLGTLLMPVFGLFFPIEVAIMLTAIVHFSNNLFKLGLFYKHIKWDIIARFGIPSIIAAFFGAFILTRLSNLQPLFEYSIGITNFKITPIKFTIAILLIFFSLMELIPKLAKLQFDKKYMPLGGLLSGFFGGLSGNQGAFRSAFLIKSGLTKEVYIGTSVVIACFVDITRLSIYSRNIFSQIDNSGIILLIVATLSAFIGVYFGKKLFKKITIKALQIMVSIMLVLFAVLLGAGLI